MVSIKKNALVFFSLSLTQLGPIWIQGLQIYTGRAQGVNDGNGGSLKLGGTGERKESAQNDFFPRLMIISNVQELIPPGPKSFKRHKASEFYYYP